MKRNSAYSGTFPLCQLAEYPLFSFLCSAYTNFDMTTVHIENDRGETIVGLFEYRDIDANREKPRLVLIGHGVQGNAAHVNRDVCGENDLFLLPLSFSFQGHKNYLFQRLLGEKLPYSSFRFDFRGNGDSSGTAGYGNIAVKHARYTPHTIKGFT